MKYVKWILIACLSSLYGQNIDFFENEKSENVDYTSFFPMMLLTYSMGDFYKLPKNPVFSPSSFGWDSQDVADPFVHVTADSIYLYYDGSSATQYSIGYSVRDESGWYWIKRKQILTPDASWRSFHLIAPTKIPGQNLLIYNGNNSDSELGYRTGIAAKSTKWEFLSDLPLFENKSGTWDFAGSAYQDIVFIPQINSYKMWYSGFAGIFSQIGVMNSSDGVHWQKEEKAVFQSLPAVLAPEVLFNGKEYLMFFVQLNIKNGLHTSIKSVESGDGVNWANVKSVLDPEELWEGNRLMRPNLSFFEEQLHLYYCAQKGSSWHIGEAVADASFQSSGFWVSPELPKFLKSLSVKYELPYQTDIKFSLLNGSDQEILELDLNENRKELRQNVYEKKIQLNHGPGEYKIRIDLSTKNINKSPVIYDLLWE